VHRADIAVILSRLSRDDSEFKFEHEHLTLLEPVGKQEDKRELF